MNQRAKILIVDDDPFNIDSLEQELEDLNLDTVTATNGFDALTQVEAESPDAILLDIMMPGMNGFEVLAHLMAHSLWRDIPVIIISALDDMENTVKGIELGAVDYLPKPYSPVLLKARVNSSLLRKRLRDLERAERRLASVVQRMLLPQHIPQLAGWDVATYYQPAHEVGGDFYDFIPFADGSIGFVVGDVSDKGIPAALVMSTIRTALRLEAERLVAPGKVLAQVNDLLYPETPATMFVTCFYALLEPASGHMVFANAGHDLPYRRRQSGVDTLYARGMPLGLMPGMTYEENQIHLLAGETILFHSDGLVEAHDGQRTMFGFPRLQALIEQHPGGKELVTFLLSELAAFTGPDWEQEDDVTLVALQRTCAAPC